MKTLVSAYNCIFGSRFLGVYASTMREWPSLQQKYQCYFVVDDVVGLVTQPVDTLTFADKAMVAAGQFVAAGVDPRKASIVLTSELPELFEIAFLLSRTVDVDEVAKRHLNTFAAHLPTAQRRKLGLAANASVAEVSYPYLGISAYALALGADFWQGGSEVAANHQYMTELAELFNREVKRSVFKSPKLLLSKLAQFPAADGTPMTYANRLSIDASEDEVRRHVDAIRDANVFAMWLEVASLTAAARAVRRSGVFGDKERDVLMSGLVSVLTPFREPRVTNRQVLRALSRGTKAAREQMQDTLRSMRAALGFSSYLSRFGVKQSRR